jgi:hypothetical protein
MGYTIDAKKPVPSANNGVILYDYYPNMLYPMIVGKHNSDEGLIVYVENWPGDDSGPINITGSGDWYQKATPENGAVNRPAKNSGQAQVPPGDNRLTQVDAISGKHFNVTPCGEYGYLSVTVFYGDAKYVNATPFGKWVIPWSRSIGHIELGEMSKDPSGKQPSFATWGKYVKPVTN